jgi:hypothetical protein
MLETRELVLWAWKTAPVGYMGDHKTTDEIIRSDAQKQADFLTTILLLSETQ